MCTVIILPGPPGHFLLAGNRDELKTRKRATPPQAPFTLPSGAHALMPIDTDAHGTWTGVNTHGLAISLLNNYPEDVHFTPKAPAKSRGMIVRRLLECTNLEELCVRLKQDIEPELAYTRPFVMIAAHAKSHTPMSALQTIWDGRILQHDKLMPPGVFVSSGVQEPEARMHRTAALTPLIHAQIYEKTNQTTRRAQVLKAFASHTPYKGPFSVCMARQEAHTVSHTYIEVTHNDVSLLYLDGPPDSAPERHHTSLSRSLS